MSWPELRQNLEGKYVPASGPRDAEIAIIGQSPGVEEGRQGRPFVGDAGQLMRKWLRDVGIDPERCYYTNYWPWVLLGATKPPDKDSARKQMAERLQEELGHLPRLRAVALVGSFASHLAFKYSMSQMQGKSGRLFEQPDIPGSGYPCIAIWHPSYWLRNPGYQHRSKIEADVLGTLAMLHALGESPVLPDIIWHDRIDPEPLRSEPFGLDVETEDIPELRAAMKLKSNDGPDPRAVRLLLVGTSNGFCGREINELNPALEPVIYNQPYDAVALGQWDARWHDPKMLAHLMGFRNTEMKSMALRLLKKPVVRYGDYPPDSPEFRAYCVQDAQAHLGILRALLEQAPEGVKSLYERIERPMMRLWARWAMEGVFVLDRKGAEEEILRLEAHKAQCREAAREILGIENLNSAQQICKALGLKSSGADILARYKTRPGVAPILSFRQAKKRADYIKKWLSWPFPRLGTLWRPTGTWTGRVSSAAMNLQNVPKYLKRLLLADPGFALYEADYSQLEIRIAAHVSQDRNMISVFNGPEDEADVHGWVMQELGITERRYAKVAVFATMYDPWGKDESAIRMQAVRFDLDPDDKTLMANLKEIQQAIRRIMPGFFQYANRVADLEVVPGIFGRLHYAPPSEDEEKRRREKVNCGIQGGAGDIPKIAAVKLEKGGLYTVHQIHDSVFIKVPEQYANEDTKQDIKRIMETCVRLSVPLKVDVKRWNSP